MVNKLISLMFLVLGYYTPSWDSNVDINVVNRAPGGRRDMRIDIKDLSANAKLCGFVGDPWTLEP